ncbi:MAG: hypothetical protein WCR52_10005 [Bacteroidota bacterium]
MKSQFFAALVTFFFAAGIFSPVFAAQSPLTNTDVQVVMTQKKIRFVADESPVKCLRVMMTNEQGAVVIQKQFNSKITDWSIDVRELPAGTYQLQIDDLPAKTFVKEAPHA